jgi:uncharacterized protein
VFRRSIPCIAYIRMSSRAFNVSVDHHRSTVVMSTTSGPATLSHDTKLVDELLERTSLLVSPSGTNLVAFSGGVDSSLVAYLVQSVGGWQGKEVASGRNVAVLGISPAVPKDQIDMAEHVASWIGIEMIQVHTQEGKDPTYIANKGQACLACKTHLYQALHAVVNTANTIKKNSTEVTLFNGTNADDTLDNTRVGLLAAKKFQVQSPLEFITKDDVRRASRTVGLPNWNHAASPCLRSRIALGVEATAHHLKLIERAEVFVKDYLLQLLMFWQKLQDNSNCHTTVMPNICTNTLNLRVRFLAHRRAAIELDQHILSLKISPTYSSAVTSTTLQDILLKDGRIRKFLENELGFHGYIVRPFKSGSVATATSNLSTIELSTMLEDTSSVNLSTR